MEVDFLAHLGQNGEPVPVNMDIQSTGDSPRSSLPHYSGILEVLVEKHVLLLPELTS